MSKSSARRFEWRMPKTAELIEIKELAWLARDGVGLERTALIEGITAKLLHRDAEKGQRLAGPRRGYLGPSFVNLQPGRESQLKWLMRSKR